MLKQYIFLVLAVCVPLAAKTALGKPQEQRQEEGYQLAVYHGDVFLFPEFQCQATYKCFENGRCQSSQFTFFPKGMRIPNQDGYFFYIENVRIESELSGVESKNNQHFWDLNGVSYSLRLLADWRFNLVQVSPMIDGVPETEEIYSYFGQCD